MRKYLLLITAFAVSMAGMSQSSITHDRVIVRDGLFLKGTWLDSVQKEGDFQYHRTIPTSKAVADYFNSRMSGIPSIVENGLTQSGDTIRLGGPLDRYTYFQVKNNRQIPYSTLGPTAVFIGNQLKDTSMFNYIFPNPPEQDAYGKSNLYLTRYNGDLDTLYMSYGALVNAFALTELSESNLRHNTQSKPILMPYGSYNGTNQLIPPDSAQWQTSPYGHTSVYSGDLGIGGTTPFWLNLYSAGLTPQYPHNVMRMGIDMARRSSTIKREIIGGPLSVYVADFRSQGGNITGATPDYGSYTNKIVNFHAYGNLNAHLTSPSKAKTLSVSTLDTVINFLGEAQWTDKNETKNGYGLYLKGGRDMHYMQGRLKIGPGVPFDSESSIAQLMVDSTVTFGKNSPQGAYFINNQVQTGVTPATLSSKKAQSFYNSFDWSFDAPTDLQNKFVYPILSRLWLRADSLQPVYQNVFGNGMSASGFEIHLRKKSGYLDTTYFVGPNDPQQVVPSIQARLDVTDAGLASTRPKIMTGVFSMFSPQFSINDWNFLRGRLLWSVWGQSFYGGSQRAVDTSAYIYMLPHNSIVGTKYAIQQMGTADSNIFNGPTKLFNPSLSNTSTTDANYTIPGDVAFTTLVEITANRTVSMPAPSAGKLLTIWNTNSTPNMWEIIGTVKNPDGTTISDFMGDSVYQLIGTGSEWVRTN